MTRRMAGYSQTSRVIVVITAAIVQLNAKVDQGDPRHRKRKAMRSDLTLQSIRIVFTISIAAIVVSFQTIEVYDGDTCKNRYL